MAAHEAHNNQIEITHLLNHLKPIRNCKIIKSLRSLISFVDISLILVREQEFFLLLLSVIREDGLVHLSWSVLNDDVSRIDFHTSLCILSFAIDILIDD